MRRLVHRVFILLLLMLTMACVSRQQIPRPEEQYIALAEEEPKTFEKDLLPFIIEQINHTAGAFFYDDELLNTRLGWLVNEANGPSGNMIKGENETGGLCADYSSHFIENYRGPGKVYLLAVGNSDEATLERIIKPFDINDIIVRDILSLDSYIEERYNSLINDEYMKLEDTDILWEWRSDTIFPFYTRTINGIVYWSEKPFKPDSPLIPLNREHLRIQPNNYLIRREEQRIEQINRLYNFIQDEHEARKIQGRTMSWNVFLTSEDWDIPTLHLRTTREGQLFLVESIPVQVPETHAGKTEDFINHAWVRIIWEGLTIDVDPTWYDNGLPLEQVISVILE